LPFYYLQNGQNSIINIDVKLLLRIT